MKEKHVDPPSVKVDSSVDGGRSESLIQRWITEQRTDLDLAVEPCESPIETMLTVALLSARDGHGPFLRRVDRIAGTKPSPIAKGRTGALYLQYPMTLEGRSLRLDFAMLLGKKRVAVETDGHDFHERTKEQAASDKSRDRLLTAAGWWVLRFTGSEVYRDAAKCAGEVLAVLGCVAVRRHVSPGVALAKRVDSRIVPPKEDAVAAWQAEQALIKQQRAARKRVTDLKTLLPEAEPELNLARDEQARFVAEYEDCARKFGRTEPDGRITAPVEATTSSAPVLGGAAGVLRLILAEDDSASPPVRRPFVPRPRAR